MEIKEFCRVLVENCRFPNRKYIAVDTHGSIYVYAEKPEYISRYNHWRAVDDRYRFVVNLAEGIQAKASKECCWSIKELRNEKR